MLYGILTTVGACEELVLDSGIGLLLVFLFSVPSSHTIVFSSDSCLKCMFLAAVNF